MGFDKEEINLDVLKTKSYDLILNIKIFVK